MRVAIPSPLRSYTGGQAELDVTGSTLSAILGELDRRHPGIRFRMVDEQNRLRSHILVFVNGTVVRDLNHLVGPYDEVRIVAALSGG